MPTNIGETHAQGERFVRHTLTKMGFRILPSTRSRTSFRVALGQKSLPVRVKTIRYGSWQFTGSALLDISVSDNGIQTVHGRKTPTDPDLLCVLVKLDEAAYFVLTLDQLYDAIYTHYRAYLEKHGGRRPRKPDSMHCGLTPLDLAPYAENWDLFRRRLGN